MECAFDAFSFESKPVAVMRCGYTGEDGFEVSVPNDRIDSFMERLMG
jgi:glycine cleavage system aminomethyltransferase T